MKEIVSIKTDYEVLGSLIKIVDLISYAKNNDIKTLGIIDNNLSGAAELINECSNNNIKPIIGLEVKLNDKVLYLYAKDYDGLVSLYKINTYLLDNELNMSILTKYTNSFIVLIPYDSISIYEEINKVFKHVFIGYITEEEKKNSLVLTKNVIYFNVARSFNSADAFYLNYLNMIKDNLTYNEYTDKDYSTYYLRAREDISDFTSLIDIKVNKNKNLIPHYDESIKDSYKYLESLAIKGLTKRLNNNVSIEYKNRLLYELNIIKQMNFVDYFLIVYDYVKFAIKNDILIGPGRGSAAGSLVTYSLGITSVDPIKYGLLFERFLNPERITMPDIDIDFDSSKRNEVIEYVKSRYGEDKAMPIMTYGTLTSKAVLLAVSKILNVSIDAIAKHIDSKKSLKDNLTETVKKELLKDNDLKKVYYDALKIEGLKKHISTHAAGVVISNQQLDNIIPIVKSGNTYLTGYTMNYLESLGLLKMDFLAIKDLTTISEILKNIPDKINIKDIDLNDEKVLNEFTNAKTIGIFQFESTGMKNFLRKLKPKLFTDLVVSLALYRPGPMDNIDSFIKRREGKEKIDYLDPSLEKVLKETYGIIVYQEQIMQIFNIIGGYSVAEADLIRRAISKKKENVIKEERIKFITKAKINGYSEELSNKIYDLIMKFANYGFNKSHSVGYALVAFEMMYLKVYYPNEFYSCLLDINIGSSIKTKEYIDEAKSKNIKVLKPDINYSDTNYYNNDGIIMPLSCIKNVGQLASIEIIKERNNGLYKDFFDFIVRTYNKSINTKIIENLIYGGAFDSFNETRHTLVENIKPALIYAELASGLDESFITKPTLEQKEEYTSNELMDKELELFGFYVSNHPASKYNGIKIIDINKYFDKNIETIGLIESIRTIHTKKGDTMAFISLSDETGKIDYTIFPNRINYINLIKKGDLIKVLGHVEKRMDKYQIIINKIDIIK